MWIWRVLRSVFGRKRAEPHTGASGIDTVNARREAHGLSPIVGGEVVGYDSPDPASKAFTLHYARRLAVILKSDPDLYAAVGVGVYTLAEAEEIARKREERFPANEHAADAPPEPVKEECKPGGCGKGGCKRRTPEPEAAQPAPASFTFSFDPFREGK